MKKKYQVFISSTYEDLKVERSKVRDAILKMSHFPIGMEIFGATDESQWEIIREAIESSDYYVLIVGTRYGSVIPKGFPDAGMSYTEKEFRYALEKGVPVLSFIISNNVQVKPEYVEKDYPKRLEAFKEEIKKGRLIEKWENPDDLANKVSTSLYNQMQRRERPGWFRDDLLELEKSRKTISELTKRIQRLENNNNTLLSENQELKRRCHRKPKLFVSLREESTNDDRSFGFSINRGNDISVVEQPVVHLKVCRVETEEIEKKYRPVSKADFSPELVTYVTDEEISEYNNSLPSEKEIKDYLDEYRVYRTIVDNGSTFNVIFCNKGTLKATSVSARFFFPEEILVLKTSEVRERSEPRPPRKPKDLQKIVRARAYAIGTTFDNLFGQFNPLPSTTPSLSQRIDSIVANIKAFESVSVSNNSAEIEVKEILHTKFEIVSGIYLVPSKRGTFKAKVSVMCAEYEKPEETSIIFECE